MGYRRTIGLFCPPQLDHKPDIQQWIEVEQILLKSFQTWKPKKFSSSFYKGLILRKPLVSAGLWIFFLALSGFLYFIPVGFMILFILVFSACLMGTEVLLNENKGNWPLDHKDQADLIEQLKCSPMAALPGLFNQIYMKEVGTKDLTQLEQLIGKYIRWTMVADHLLHQFGKDMTSQEQLTYVTKVDDYRQHIEKNRFIPSSVFMDHWQAKTQSEQDQITLERHTPQVPVIMRPNRL